MAAHRALISDVPSIQCARTHAHVIATVAVAVFRAFHRELFARARARRREPPCRVRAASGVLATVERLTKFNTAYSLHIAYYEYIYARRARIVS